MGKSYHTEALPKLKQPKMGVIGLESDKRKERQEEEAGDLESIGVGEEAGGREAVQESCCIRWRCFSLTFLLLIFLVTCFVVALPLLEKGEGLNLIGKTAKQVQPKVDEEKVRACSTYYWRRSEIKEKASIYYRGGDIYKGEVTSLQGGPNAISRYVDPDDSTLPDGWGEMRYQDGSRF